MYRAGPAFCHPLLFILLFVNLHRPCLAGSEGDRLYNDAVFKDSTNQVLFSLTREEQQYLEVKKRITMCVDPDWMPLEKIEKGRHIGMTAEYMDIFSRIIGIPIVMIPTVDWMESIAYAKARKCDIFSLAMPTPERETYMNFTRPYLDIPLVMAAKIDTPFIDDISTITDKTIGIVRGYAFNELLRKRHPKMKIVDVDSVSDGLKKVVEGDIFGFIGTLATVGYTIQKDFVGELKVSGKFDERWKLGIAARNDEPLLVNIFDKAIASIDPATHQKILNNWIAVRFERGKDYEQLWRFIPLALAVVLALLYRTYDLGKYNRKLEQQNREIRNQAEKLRQAEQQLLFTQHAVETCVFPIVWIKNSPVLEETSIIHANRAAATMLGYSPEELSGLSVAHIDAEISQERWEEELQGMKESAFYTLTTICLRKDGSTFPAELYLNYFEYEKEDYHFAFFMDVSRQREMEEKLHRSMKMEAVGLMAGGVAHDLNNILSGIVSYPELLLLKLPDDSELRAPLVQIRDSGLRAAEVVADMLTVTRGAAAARETVNINTLIREQLDSPEFKQIVEDLDDLTCRTELDPDLLNISCSPIHIRKSLLNLLINAAEAVNGQGTITVSTANCYIDRPVSENQYMKEGEYVILSVADDGPGISPEDQKHIFEPFYSKKVMGKSGTGLGLTIVWNTVQDHGGDITVESDENGTTFTLYFPATRAKIEPRKEKMPDDSLQGNGSLILVVDDEAQQRDIAGQLLESLGYRVLSASSGEEALAVVKEEDVDLVLLDMIMDPGMNGRQCYEQMLRFKPNLKAVIASGFSESDEVKKTLAQGASAFIRKPYTMTELGNVIHTALKIRTTAGENPPEEARSIPA
ncbi:response regulator [Desulfolithobacter sp.]